MRTRALTLLLLLASCGQGGNAPNQAGPMNQAGAQAGPAAGVTVTLAATGPMDCAATWNGEAISVAELPDRAFALVQGRAEARGGARNLRPEDLPPVTVQAPEDLSFACAGRALASLQGSAMRDVQLQVPGRAAVPVEFPIEGAPPPPIVVVLAIVEGGQVLWDSQPVAPEALDARLRPGPAGPGLIEVHPSRDATFGQVYAVLRAARAAQATTLLVPVPPAVTSETPPAAPPSGG